MLITDQGTECHIKGIISQLGTVNISLPRNKLVREFLDEYDGDWLLMLDTDMVFDVDLVNKLLEHADPEKVPVITGLYFGLNKDNRLFPQIFYWQEQDDALAVSVQTYERDALIQIDATGAGCLMVHRSVLHKMREKYGDGPFPWFKETEEKGLYLGEDFTFFARLSDMGIPVHMHTGIKLGHQKYSVVDERGWNRQQVYLAVEQQSQKTSDELVLEHDI